MANENGQQQDIGQTGPSTDLSAANQPAGTTRVENGVAYGADGKPLGQASEAPAHPAGAFDFGFGKQPPVAAPPAAAPAQGFNFGFGKHPPAADLEHAPLTEGQHDPVGSRIGNWVQKGLLPAETLGDWINVARDYYGRKMGIPEHLIQIDPKFQLPENKTLAKIPLAGHVFEGGEAYAGKFLTGSASEFTSSQTSPMNIALLGGGAAVSNVARAGASVRAIQAVQQATTEMDAAEAIHATRLAELSRVTQESTEAQKALEAAKEGMDAGTTPANQVFEAQLKASQLAKTLQGLQEAVSETTAAREAAAAKLSNAARAAVTANRLAQGVPAAQTLAKVPQGVTVGAQTGLGLTGLGLAATQIPAIFKGQQPGETPAEYIERRYGALGWTLLGAAESGHALNSKALSGDISKLPSNFMDDAKAYMAYRAKNPSIASRAAGKIVNLVSAPFRGDTLEDLYYKLTAPTKREASGGKFEDKIATAMPALREIVNRNPEPGTPEEMSTDINNFRSEADNKLLSQATQYKGKPEASMVGLEQQVRDALNQAFDNAGASYTPEERERAFVAVMQHVAPNAEEGGNINPDLWQAERARKRFNDDIAPSFDTGKEVVPPATRFAKSIAATVLREAIDQKYDDLGVQGVKEWRKIDSALIDVRDNIADATKKANDMGEYSLWKSFIKQIKWHSLLTGIVTEGATHNPELAIAGGLGSALLGVFADWRRDRNVNPNTLIERIVEKTLNQGPPSGSVQPLFGQAPPAQRQGSKLHAALASHYGVFMDDPNLTYDSLERMFRQQMSGKANRTPEENSLLAKFNDFHASEAEKQAKAHAEDLAAKTEGEEENPLGIKQAAAATALPTEIPWETTDREIPQNPRYRSTSPRGTRYHELGHLVWSHMMGMDPIDIVSHLHPDIDEGANAEARTGPGIFMDDEGNLDENAVKDNIYGLLARFMAGGVAEEVFDGNPFEKNRTTDNDVRLAKKFLSTMGIKGRAADAYLEHVKDHVRNFMTQPEIRELLVKYGERRGLELEDQYHLDAPGTQQFVRELKGAIEKYDERQPNARVKGPGEGGKTKTSRKVQAEPEDRGVSGQPRTGPKAGPKEKVREAGGPSGQEGTTQLETKQVTKPAEDVIAEGKARGLKEATTGSPQRDAAIKAAGAVPAGIFKGDAELGLPEYSMFHDPKTGTTMQLRSDRVTPEAVKAEMEKSRGAYGLKTQQRAVAPEIDHDEVLNNIQRAYGVHDDPKLENQAGFITPDARHIDLPSSIMHSDAIEDAGGGKAEGIQDNRPDFINNTGTIRVHKARERAGNTLAFSVPKGGVTADQAEAMARSFGANGDRNGVLRIERADIKPETKDKLSAEKDFPRASDVKPMLEKINGLKKEDLKTKQETAEKEKTVAEGANDFNAERGRQPVDSTGILHNPETAKRIADQYDLLQHNANDPAVKKAYGAAVKDINDQWNYAQDKMGIKFEPWTKEGQPYANSKEMKADVDNNKHLYFFTGGELPKDHPLAQVDPETGYTYNDKLRAVHDLFGHAAHGFQFGPKGEENAWNVHRQMFSSDAIPAITTETRGQNSWVNFGKHLRNAEGNIPAKGEQGFVSPTERPYAANKAAILPEEFHQPQHWSEQVANNLDKEPAGGINPNNPDAPSKRYGYEIAPEVRKPLENKPTAADFANYATEPQVQNLLKQHPDVKLGWDTTGEKPELNVGATTNDLAKAKENAAKLDQRSFWDNVEKKEVPVGGKGEKTQFPEYPIENRLDDLRTTQKTEEKTPYPGNPEGFEHIHPDLLANMEPDEREFVKGDKRKQKAVESAYNDIAPSMEETKAAIEAGHPLGGWWQRFIDTFKALGQTDEANQIEKLGPEHAEALKAWHSAVSGNKSVEDANRMAWGTYADWLDAGRPRDRAAINKIVVANGKAKGNAAISDTTRRGKVVHEGLDTTKLTQLVNSPQMRDENPEPFHGSVYDPNNPSPVAGKTNGARKISSMAATVAGEGNLNRLVLDAHMLDFYGQNGWTDNKYIAHSIHLRQAAKELGLQGGEAQEQIWGTVLGIKQLLREGVPANEIPNELTNDTINSIGKDYADVIKGDPELYAIFEQLKKHGLDPGGDAAQRRLADIAANKPAAKEARTDKGLLANVAERIKGRMKNLPTESNTSFNFGHNSIDLNEGLKTLQKEVPASSAKPQWAAYAKPGPYVTHLPPDQEKKFQEWVKDNHVPWQDVPNADYDMRGFWKGAQEGDPEAHTEVNPVDHKIHYADKWKTPYHKTFSVYSQYAKPTAGHWEGQKFVPPTAESGLDKLAGK